MRIKLDENLSHQLRAVIDACGHETDTVADEGLLSQSDQAVGEAAKREGRMLLTLDLDFSDIRKYSPGTHPGIVLFRPLSLGVNAVFRFVEEFVTNTDLDALSGCLVVVDYQRVRVRRPD
jgi:predicted nuclease of predicted toxin-antitoxin system